MVLTRAFTSSKSAFTSLLKPRNNVLAVSGDSRPDQMFYESITPVPPAARGVAYHLRTLSKGRILVDDLYNFGTSGHTVSQWYDNLGAVIASGVGMCLIVIGTNSINNSTETFATISTKIHDGVIAIRDAGIVPIVATDGPRTDWDATEAALWHRVVNYVQSLQSIRGVVILDTLTSIVDTASTVGVPIAGQLVDTVHWGPSLAFTLAKRLLPLIEAWFPAPFILPASSGDLYHATDNPYGSLVLNPLLTGDVSGVPTSWAGAASGTGIALASSKEADGSYLMDVSGTPSTSLPSVMMSQAITLGNLNDGDKVVAAVEFNIDAGFTGLVCPSVILDNAVTLTRVWGGAVVSGDNPIITDLDYSGVAISAVYTHNAADPPASLTMRFRPYFYNGAAALASIYVTRAAAFKVASDYLAVPEW